MFSHVVVGSDDLEKAKVFYDAALAPLGIICRSYDLEGGWITYASPGRVKNRFFVCRPIDGAAASVGNGTTIAFAAPDRESVDRFHAAAIAAGGTDEGAPGLRPNYVRNFYGAYVRDPQGHKICCVCLNPPEEMAAS
jgi:catechol 2,3-dioxygenase-like lactoylglutathione lyase family enzyme